MIFPNTTLLFESDVRAQLFRELYPSLKDQIVSLDSFLPPPPINRLDIFRKLFPEIRDTERALFTFETLRESLILNDEHLEHCFSELPQTPKNRALKKLLSRYLASELKEDRTQRIWNLIEDLKNKRSQVSLQKNILLIGDMPFLLHELALGLTYASGVESAQVIDPSRLAPTDNTAIRCYSGKESETLVALANRVKDASFEGKVLIPFGGVDKTKFFLKRALEFKRISFDDYFESGRSGANVALIPFQSLPALPGYQIVPYADHSLWEPPMHELLFSFSEIETLHRAGFSLPRYVQYRERVLATLSYYGTHERCSLFTTLDIRRLSDRAAEPLPTVAFSPRLPTAQDTDAMKIDLPARPLSATQLETYSQCPAKYLFGNRLRLRPILSSEEQYALIFGQSVHHALEHYLGDNKGSSTPEDPRPLLMEYFHKGLQANAPDLSPSLVTILESHFEKIITRFLKLEGELKTLFGNGQPMILEAPFEIDIDGLKLRGKIDRIDRTEAGILILDYKTGNVDFSPDHVCHGVHFQALLYLMGAEKVIPETPVGILFYDLKKGELRRGILREEAVSAETKKAVTRGHTVKADKYRAIQEEGIAQLKRLAEKISSGDFRANPTPDNCRFCEFPTLCRRGYGYV